MSEQNGMDGPDISDLHGNDADARRIVHELEGSDLGTDPFVAAVRATRMPMIITDPRRSDNPAVFVNDAFCRLTGYDRDEILGRNCRMLQGPLTDRDAVAKIHKAVEAREPIEIEIRNHRKDGSSFWNRLLLAPVRDRRGDLAYFFASQLDVTAERERMAGLENDKAALLAQLAGRLQDQEESERELRFTLDAGQFGDWSLDLQNGALTSSAAYRAMLGRDPVDPLSLDDMKAAIHPDDRPAVDAAIRRSVADRTTLAIDHRVLTRGGELRWIAVRGRPSYAADEVPSRMTGISIDITDHKRAEAMRSATIALSDAFRDLDDPTDISFAAAEAIGRTLGVERAGYGVIDRVAETITIDRGWTAQDVPPLDRLLRFRDYGSYIDELKRGITVVVEDALADPRTADHADALVGIDARSFINMPVTEQGGFVALLYVTYPDARRWRDDEIAFMRDIAERTRIATERRRAEQELAALAASLEQQVMERTDELLQTEEALRQSLKMEAYGQLTGGVAHDFNNLLTIIRSSVDLLMRPGVPPDRQTRYLGAISETVDRAARLTGQLLAFARRQALKPTAFDVGHAVDAVADIVRTLAGPRIEVVVETASEACFALADPTQLDTAIVNMAANARDAMDGQGRLVISVAAADGIPAVRHHPAIVGRFVAVSILDTGPGFTREMAARIFEPFFTTKDVGRGTGLGLSQVFGFAKQSGGEIRVESEPEHGATFTLYLPRTDQPSVEAADVRSAEQEARVEGASILIVEDNEGVGEMTRRALREIGYEATLAADAAQALKLLDGDAHGFDVVFSDVMMPGMSGIELAQEIGRRFPKLPVILASGYSDILAKQGSFGFELVHKPYSITQVDAAVTRALGAAQHEASTTG